MLENDLLGGIWLFQSVQQQQDNFFYQSFNSNVGIADKQSWAGKNHTNIISEFLRSRLNQQNETLLQSYDAGADKQRQSAYEYPRIEKKVRNHTDQTTSVHQEDKPTSKDNHKLNEWTHCTGKYGWAQASVVKLTEDRVKHYSQKQWDMVNCCTAQMSGVDPKDPLTLPLKLCCDKQNEASKTLPCTSRTTGQDSTEARPENKSTAPNIREQGPSPTRDKPIAHTTQQSSEYNTRKCFKQSTITTVINKLGIINSQKNISSLHGNATQSKLITVIEKNCLTYFFTITNQGSFEELSLMKSGGSIPMRKEIQHIRRNPRASCIGGEQKKDRLDRQLVQLSPAELLKKTQSDRLVISPHSDRLKIPSLSAQGKSNDILEMELVKRDKVECPMIDIVDVPYVSSKNTKNRLCRSLKSRKERTSEVSPNKMVERKVLDMSNSNGPGFRAGPEDHSNRETRQCGCFRKRCARRQKRQDLGNAVHNTQPGILEGTITEKKSIFVFADTPSQINSKSATPENYTHPFRIHEAPMKIMYAQCEGESGSTSDQAPRRTTTALVPVESVSPSRKKYGVQGAIRNLPNVRKSSSYSTSMKTHYSEHSVKEVYQNKVHRMDASQLNMVIECSCCPAPINMPIIINLPQYRVPTRSMDGDPKDQPGIMFTYTYRILLDERTPDCMCEKPRDVGKHVRAKSNIRELVENSELPDSFTIESERCVTASADNSGHLNLPPSESSGPDQRIQDSSKQTVNKHVIRHFSNRRVTEEVSSMTHRARNVCGTQSDSGTGPEELKPPSPAELSHKNPNDAGSKVETRTSEKNKHLITKLEVKQSCQTKTDSGSHAGISKSNESTTQSFDSSQVLLEGVEQSAPSVVQPNPGNPNSDSENQNLLITASHVPELMTSKKRSSSEPKPITYRQANENGPATCAPTVSQMSRPETLSTSHKPNDSELIKAVKSQISEGTQHDIVRLPNKVTSQRSGKEEKHSQQLNGSRSDHIMNGFHASYQYFKPKHAPDKVGVTKGLSQSNEQEQPSENRLRLWKNTMSESEYSSSWSEKPATDVQTTACSKNSTELQLKLLESRGCRTVDEQFHTCGATDKKSSNASIRTVKLERNSLRQIQQVTVPSMSESITDAVKSIMHSNNRPKTTQVVSFPDHATAHQPQSIHVAEVHQSPDPEKSTPKQTSSYSSSDKTSYKTSEKIYACSRKTNTKLHVSDVKEENGGTQSRPCCFSSSSDPSQSTHRSESMPSHPSSVVNDQKVMINKQPSRTSNELDNFPIKPSSQQSTRTVQQQNDRAEQRLDKSKETAPTCSRSTSREPERPCDLYRLSNITKASEREEWTISISRGNSRLCNGESMKVSHSRLDNKEHDREYVCERNLRQEALMASNHSTIDNQQVTYDSIKGNPDDSAEVIEHSVKNLQRSELTTNDEECETLQNSSRDSQLMADDIFMTKHNLRGSATSSILSRQGQPVSLFNPPVHGNLDGLAQTSIPKRFWIENATDLQCPNTVEWCGSEGLGKLPRTTEQADNVVVGQWPSFLPTSIFPHRQQDNIFGNKRQDFTGLECPCCGFPIQVKNVYCPFQSFGCTLWTEAACLQCCQCTQTIHADSSQKPGPKINCCSNREICDTPISTVHENRRCVLTACKSTNFQCQPIRQCETSCHPDVERVIERRLLHLISPHTRYGHTRMTALHETLSRLVHPCCHSATSVHQYICNYCCSRKRRHIQWHTEKKF
ncbi:uncharacterized protein DEA37_0003498 [Paragonimus westermani]|uniref:Uncharacterized protein n=1 Tax=Paragonimus westermani TaxID=34504 RepID=A0A5J4N8P3_9TREM|nr:uncharacterized protein DEA37_0003498 [Paragonimus westermani]